MTGLQKVFKQSTYLIAALILAVVFIIVIPLPPPLIDIILSFNFTFAILVLLVTLYIQRPLEFAAFPTILLSATLFRLAMNIATTRAILTKAYAGQVILAFGRFVAGGNLVVGFVIFIIIVIIQFVVITSGAQRIAEVAARFTLDAMPGKQMAVDADLNAGLITEEEAKERRKEIMREADFYGAMDGACRFVRGDAVAGLVITAVNIIGGLIIGVLIRKMSVSEALRTYTILTIGDGLCAQIPSFMMATAAGVIVSRVAEKEDFGQSVIRQMFTDPRAAFAAAAGLFICALVPGLPTIPFLIVATMIGVVAYLARKYKRMKQIEKEKPKRKEEPKTLDTADEIRKMIQVEPLELNIGYGLIPLVDKSQGGDLLERITSVRHKLAQELGIIIPPMRVRDDINLKPTQYSIKIKGVEAGKGEVYPNRLLAINPGTAEKEIEGIKTKEPAFGLKAVWILPSQKEEAESAGYSVVQPSGVIVTHIAEVIKRHADELLNRESVQRLINIVRETHPTVVEELTPKLMSVGEIQKVLQRLVKENVPIKDLPQIFEVLADNAQYTKDIDVLVEKVRQALSAQICKQYADSTGTIYCITLEPSFEQKILQALSEFKEVKMPTLEPQVMEKFYTELAQGIEKIIKMGKEPVLLCSSGVRPYIRKMIEPMFPHLAVLSYNEVSPYVKVKGIAQVGGGT